MPESAAAPIIASFPLNTVQQGDNLELMKMLPGDSIDLVYIDPPYNTGAAKSGRSGTYADAWPTMDDYLAFMTPRVAAIHRILKPTGSILLHCDWRTCHHLRLVLDAVFGSDRFVNHLIWKYGLGGSSPRTFARKHDDILFYGKTDSYYFDVPMIPATSQRLKGQMKKATDILDIPSLNNMAAERTGYPTQKPLALLELLVQSCCPVGGSVGDFFCGSGTTLVAATNTGRQYIGCDQSEQAIATTQERLKAHSKKPNE